MPVPSNILSDMRDAEADYDSASLDFVEAVRSLDNKGSSFPFVPTGFSLDNPGRYEGGSTNIVYEKTTTNDVAGDGYAISSNGVMRCGKGASGKECRDNCIRYGYQKGAYAVIAGHDGTCKPLTTAEEAAQAESGNGAVLPGGTWIETAWTPSQPTYGMTGLFAPRLEGGRRVLSCWLRTGNNMWKLARSYVENGAEYSNVSGRLVRTLNGVSGMALITLQGEWPRRSLKLENNFLFAGNAKAFFVEAGDVLRYVSFADVSKDCECIPCGQSQSYPYTNGVCSVGNDQCSAVAGSTGSGCYSSVDKECDCASKKTTTGVLEKIVKVSGATAKEPPAAETGELVHIDYRSAGAEWASSVHAQQNPKIARPYGAVDKTATALSDSQVSYSDAYWMHDDMMILSNNNGVKQTRADCQDLCNKSAACKGYTTFGGTCGILTESDMSGPQIYLPGASTAFRKPTLLNRGECTSEFVQLDPVAAPPVTGSTGKWSPCGDLAVLQKRQAAVAESANLYQRNGAVVASAMTQLDERDRALFEQARKGKALRSQLVSGIGALSGHEDGVTDQLKQGQFFAEDQALLTRSRLASAAGWTALTAGIVGLIAFVSRN